MTFSKRLAEKIRRGDPLPLPVHLTLAGLSPFYRLGMLSRSLSPKVRVDAYVISIGNLTAGGTGKTPAVIERAQAEVRKGKRVAVLTRGYGGETRDEVAVFHAGTLPANAAREYGDEPVLIATKVPESIVVRGKDRVRGARIAVEQHQCDTLILDDGFQSIALERDEDIVLLDARNPFGNGYLLPRGVLREPPTALSRATHVVLTRCDEVADISKSVEAVRLVNSNVSIRLTVHAATHFLSLSDGEELPLDAWRGQKVAIACAIGNPESFIHSIQATGAIVAEQYVFADHENFADRLPKIQLPLLLTEKDAVRISSPKMNAYALAIALRDFEPTPA